MAKTLKELRERRPPARRYSVPAVWMWIRPLAMILALQASLTAVRAAESLHLAPTGTVVSGSFDLAGKLIPLPEGEFVLAAARLDDARLVSVFLAQLDGQRLKSAVWASTVLQSPAPRSNWVPPREPCEREKALFSLDLAKDESHGEYAQHNCLVVERRVGSFGAGASGIVEDAAAWLAYHDVVVPVPVLIIAEITRIERHDLVRAAYAFNPWSYGCNRPSPPFVESITGWGKRVQQHFDDPVMGRRSELASLRSAIHQCASALASTP